MALCLVRLGFNLSDITPSHQLELNFQAAQEIQERGFCKPFVTQYMRPDGKPVPVLPSGAATEKGQPT